MRRILLAVVVSPFMVVGGGACSSPAHRTVPGAVADPEPEPEPEPEPNPDPGPEADPEARRILKVHNAARKAVGVAPLSWSPAIARYAQAWANRLARQQSIQHRPRSGRWKQRYGENLAMAGGSSAILRYGQKGSVQWLGEKRRYRHGSRSLAGVGHYTQMVWRKSRRMGCGIARYQRGPWKWVILVCNYDPPGNMMGESPY
jgi:pathogenesis-related protein 1